ncbi:hypothetical protein [Streptomyces kebangsaanensis]|uniref:hypothetical protein n=1 Tax=Streptomyces kebangsaanensis TaxID=864058 RepID=UPI000AA51284|nr:hypothetical protein [Streptomyces kebangsaanensis]
MPLRVDHFAEKMSLVGEGKLARMLAEEALRARTDFDGTERSPMCNAEAHVTLGATAAREGDLEQALTMGEQALVRDRQSVRSLIMTSRKLGAEMKRHYASEPAAQRHLARLHTGTGKARLPSSAAEKQ